MNLLESITSGFGRLVDKVEDGVKSVVDSLNPFDESSKMLGHYIGRNNEEYEYPVSKLRETNTIKEAEKINQDRLIDALSVPGRLRKKKFPVLAGSDFLEGNYSLSDMRDGEVFGLNDYYDVDRSNWDVLKNKDIDAFGSLGSFKMRTNGNNLQFMKTKFGILPYGYAEHEVNDIYDFDAKKEPLYAPLQAMEVIGAAYSYPVKAQWKTRPFGVIKLLDNRIDKSDMNWE